MFARRAQEAAQRTESGHAQKRTTESAEQGDTRMIAYESGPRGWSEPTAGHELETHAHYTQRYPWCKAYECRIIDRLPHKCPLTAANPLDEIHRRESEAWSSIGDFADPNLGVWLSELTKADCCRACVGTCSAYPHVRRLRELTRRTKRRQATPTNGVAVGPAPTRSGTLRCRRAPRRRREVVYVE